MVANKRSKDQKKKSVGAKEKGAQKKSPKAPNKETADIEATDTTKESSKVAQPDETKATVDNTGWIDPEQLPSSRDKAKGKARTSKKPFAEKVKQEPVEPKEGKPENIEAKGSEAFSKVGPPPDSQETKEPSGWIDPENLPSSQKKAVLKEQMVDKDEALIRSDTSNEPQSTKDSRDEINQIIDKSTQLIVFELGREEYAVPIELVKEVVPTPKILHIPETPKFVKGIGNIRGNTIAIIDLVERFGIDHKISSNGEERKKKGKLSFTLIVECGGHTTGILLDNVPESLAITADQIERNPNLIQDSTSNSNYIKGIIKIDNRMIILIDIYTIINAGLERVHDQAVEA